MPGSTTRRNTTTRDRHRAVLRRGHPPCALCHEEIDYTLRSPDPMSFVIDHKVPLARGGADDLDNLQPAHRTCNQAKAAKTAEELAQAAAQAGPRVFVTQRSW